MNETFKAYVAGLVDGEGTIIIACHSQQKNTFYPQVAIGMCKARRTLNRLKSIYGGNIHRRKLPSGKFLDNWTTLCRQAEKFLRDIYPYLRIKKKQADLVFELNERISVGQRDNWQGLGKGEAKIRRQLYEKMKKLNR